MEFIEERVRKRRDNYFFTEETLKSLQGITFQDEPCKSFFSNRWFTAIIVDPQKAGTTQELIQKGLEKENIESRP